MQKVDQYSVLSWHEACAHRLIPKYIQMKIGFGKLHSLIDEYWLPGQRNRDRLLRECRERALNDSQTANQDFDEA